MRNLSLGTISTVGVGSDKKDCSILWLSTLLPVAWIRSHIHTLTSTVSHTKRPVTSRSLPEIRSGVASCGRFPGTPLFSVSIHKTAISSAHPQVESHLHSLSLATHLEVLLVLSLFLVLVAPDVCLRKREWFLYLFFDYAMHSRGPVCRRLNINFRSTSLNIHQWLHTEEIYLSSLPPVDSRRSKSRSSMRFEVCNISLICVSFSIFFQFRYASFILYAAKGNIITRDPLLDVSQSIELK